MASISKAQLRSQAGETLRRVEVGFDLLTGKGSAAMRCTKERLSRVSTINVWAPHGRSSFDSIRLAR